MPLIVKVAVPVFFSVTTCAALAEFTVWLPKLNAVGARLTAGIPVPVPLRLTVWGRVATLSDTALVPAKVPVAQGLKTTLNVQLAPAASVLVQVAPGPK